MIKKHPEAKRHHFIPKFIIRNFSSNELDFIRYFNKKTGKFSNEPIEEIFMYNNLYRDEINSPEDPVKIEKDFSRYENEVSHILKKFLKGDDIVITKDENDSLLLFLALMRFRSKRVLPTFGDKASQQTKDLYSPFQKDEDLLTLWKRNLGELVNCRSIYDVLQNDKIDEPIKIFMNRDTVDLYGMYFIIAERRGGEDFFLSDSCPIDYFGKTDEGIEILLMSFFPISPERILISCCCGIRSARQDVRHFNRSFFAFPENVSDKTKYRFRVKKLYEQDVRFINDTLYKHTNEGVVLFDQNRFYTNRRNK